VLVAQVGLEPTTSWL